MDSDVLGNCRLQVGHAFENATANALVRDVAKEALDHVEPRRTGGREVHVKSGVLGQPGEYLRVLVSRIVVHDQVQLLLVRRLAIDGLKEAQPFLMPVELIGHRHDLAGEYVQCGEQRRHAVALVVVRQRRTPSTFERQTGLRAVERLDLRLLVAAQHQRMLGRVKIQAHDVLELLDEVRVVGQLEGLDPMRLESWARQMRATVEAFVPRYSAMVRVLQ